MTRRRVARWFAPYRLLADEHQRSAALRARVGEQVETIRALRVEVAVTEARWHTAERQRDRARDLVGALLGEARAFSAGDLAFLDEHGVEA